MKMLLVPIVLLNVLFAATDTRAAFFDLRGGPDRFFNISVLVSGSSFTGFPGSGVTLLSLEVDDSGPGLPVASLTFRGVRHGGGSSGNLVVGLNFQSNTINFTFASPAYSEGASTLTLFMHFSGQGTFFVIGEDGRVRTRHGRIRILVLVRVDPITLSIKSIIVMRAVTNPAVFFNLRAVDLVSGSSVTELF